MTAGFTILALSSVTKDTHASDQGDEVERPGLRGTATLVPVGQGRSRSEGQRVRRYGFREEVL